MDVTAAVGAVTEMTEAPKSGPRPAGPLLGGGAAGGEALEPAAMPVFACSKARVGRGTSDSGTSAAPFQMLLQSST